MKIQFKQSVIYNAISNACAVIPTKSIMAIIKNIKLQAKDNEFIIYATDSEIEFTVKIKDNIKILEEGEILVDGARFRTILQEADEGDYELSLNGNIIHIAGKKCKFEMAISKTEGYPIFDSFDDKPTFEILGITLKSMFEKTVFATREEPGRYQMNGVLLKGDSTGVDVVATDLRRLALVSKKMDMNLEAEKINCILSTKYVNIIIKTLNDKTVQVLIESNKIKIKSDNVTISSKLLSGIFPEYKKAIPNCEIIAKVDKAQLMSAIRQTVIFTTENAKSVKFLFQDNLLSLQSSIDQGNASSNIDIEYEGDLIEMHLNPIFVQDGLKAINNEEITIELKDHKRPIILRGDEGYTYVIMPVTSKE